MHENMSTTQKPPIMPPIATVEEEDLGEQPLQQTRWAPIHESGDYNNVFKWPGEFTVLMDSPEKVLALIRPVLDASSANGLVAQFILYTGIVDEYLIYVSFAAHKLHKVKKQKWIWEIGEALDGARNELREARGRVCDFATPAHIAKEYANVLKRVLNILSNAETGPGRLLEVMTGEETAQAFTERVRALCERWHGPELTGCNGPNTEAPAETADDSFRIQYNGAAEFLQTAVSCIRLGENTKALGLVETGLDVLRDAVQLDPSLAG